jgi:hypothetical protein
MTQYQLALRRGYAVSLHRAADSATAARLTKEVAS